MTEQVPSVGRMVHFVGAVGQCRAAIITEVEASGVDLAIFNRFSVGFDGPVPHDELEKAAGTWHWPERVP